MIVLSLSPVDKRTQQILHAMVLTGAAFIFAVFVAVRHGQLLPFQRPLTLVIDLVLVTVAMHSFGPQGRSLFQVYYIIVVIGAIWFQLAGAITVALGAIVLYVVMPLALVPGMSSPSLADVLADLAVRGAPLLLLIALVTGYLVRTLNREMQARAEFEQEMRLARTVQDSLLPAALPVVPGYQVALRFQPARSIGGDFYDLARLPGGRYLILLGDMPGKSAYGLVHLSLIHSHTRAAALDGLPPAEIADTVNEDVFDALQPDNYAALFIGMLDPEHHAINFANCGHPPPLLVRSVAPDSRLELSTGGSVIGAERDTNYTQRRLVIEPGDLLICYTDGVSEARNARGELFDVAGIERTVREVLRQQGSDFDDLSSRGSDAEPTRTERAEARGVQEIADAIVRAAADFARTPGQDDATVMVFRREP